MSSFPSPQAYLDHAATTPLRPEAREVLVELLDDPLGNPTGAHRGAREARKVVDEARDQMAAALGCAPGEVVFTSGGTEADNLAIGGVFLALQQQTQKQQTPNPTLGQPTLLCSAIELHAVLDPVRNLGGDTIAVDAHGRLDLAALEAKLIAARQAQGDDQEPLRGLVSTMLANNEIGVIQDLTAIAEVISEVSSGVLLHTDAVQAFPWLDVAELGAPAQLVSVSAHKFGGPQGVGALVVRDGTPLAPTQLGGGQERERRSGTHNVAGIAAMAAAASAITAERTTLVTRVARLRDRLADQLRTNIEGLVETAVPEDTDGRPDRSNKIAGSLHVCIEGIESEALLFLIDQAGVAASAASSCSSGAMENSHVLEAISLDANLTRSSLRLSLGHTTTNDEVDYAAASIIDAVARLRRHQ